MDCRILDSSIFDRHMAGMDRPLCAHIFNMLDNHRMSYPKVDVYSIIMQAWQSKCFSYAANNTQVHHITEKTLGQAPNCVSPVHS